jgi:glycosyltransferase involved in cell wall biosynthesis
MRKPAGQLGCHQDRVLASAEIRPTGKGESIDSSDCAAEVDCSVLVPVLNEERDIVASVEAMLAQQFPGRLEFLLVDGGSTDRTPELLTQMADIDQRIRLLQNPQAQTASGLNVALGHARGRWVARMDAHTAYPADYLARGVERLQRGDTRWVSGPQVPVGQNSVSRAVALALRTRLGRGASRKWGSLDAPAQDEYDLDAGVFGGVWDRQTVLDYGGWDERFPRNQDSEMAGRFLAHGERLVCVPAMGARYVPRGTLRSLWRQYVDYGEYRFKTAVLHPNTLRRSHLLPPGLVITFALAAASPRPIRRLARAGLGLYASVLLGSGVATAKDADQPGDAVVVPAVLAVMHLGHGLGAVRAARRYGPPVAAIARAFAGPVRARRLTPSSQHVFAPSLRACDSASSASS